MKKWCQALLFYAGFPIVSVVGWLLLIFVETYTAGWLMTGIIPLGTVMLYVLLRKKALASFRRKMQCRHSDRSVRILGGIALYQHRIRTQHFFYGFSYYDFPVLDSFFRYGIKR